MTSRSFFKASTIRPGLLPGSVHSNHFVVDFRQVGFQTDLNVVQFRLVQFLSQGSQFAAVGYQSGYKFLGMVDQFNQVSLQSRFTAGKDDLRNTAIPELV